MYYEFFCFCFCFFQIICTMEIWRVTDASNLFSHVHPLILFFSCCTFSFSSCDSFFLQKKKKKKKRFDSLIGNIGLHIVDSWPRAIIKGPLIAIIISCKTILKIKFDKKLKINYITRSSYQKRDESKLTRCKNLTSNCVS